MISLHWTTSSTETCLLEREFQYLILEGTRAFQENNTRWAGLCWQSALLQLEDLLWQPDLDTSGLHLNSTSVMTLHLAQRILLILYYIQPACVHPSTHVLYVCTSIGTYRYVRIIQSLPTYDVTVRMYYTNALNSTYCRYVYVRNQQLYVHHMIVVCRKRPSKLAGSKRMRVQEARPTSTDTQL